jgi:hypothetical protein
MVQALEELNKVSIEPTTPSLSFNWRSKFIKSQEELDYAFSLQSVLANLIDVDIRVESPWITIYTNNKTHIATLAGLDNNKVKYISVPPNNSTLATGTIIMPKMNYDFRITLGKTTQANIAFIDWATANKKVKLTKSCEKALTKSHSWGGTHFYITGNNTLLMAKMHLGGCIAKIESIVKA